MVTLGDAGIIRDPKPEELTDPDEGFIPIVTTKGPVKTEQDKFREKVEAKQQEFVKAKKPFCTRCAYLDYDKFKRDIIEAERTGYVDFKKLGIKLPKIEEYGSEERFEFVRDGDTMNPGRWKGDPITHDKWKEFKCKIRGCGITIFQ